MRAASLADFQPSRDQVEAFDGLRRALDEHFGVVLAAHSLRRQIDATGSGHVQLTHRGRRFEIWSCRA